MNQLIDLAHYFGSDLTPTVGGDVLTASGVTRTQQRILRRLLTNPGDYKWHPTYGAGLPQWIGRTADIKQLQGLIKGQVLLEAAVAKTPTPVVLVSQIPNSQGGGFAVQMNYTEAANGSPVALSFNVSN